MKKAHVKKFQRTTDMAVKAMTRSFGMTTLEKTTDTGDKNEEKRVVALYGRGLKIKVVFTASRHTEED